MQKHKLYIALVLIAFNLALSNAAEAQSTCTAEQRKEFILTAVDKNGRVIDNLRAEHLSLKVGNARATIADVAFHTRAPLDLAVLIDTSVSQGTLLPTTKDAARAFVAFVPTAGQDRVAVVSFSDQAKYHQLLTSDFTAAGTAIDQIQLDIPPGYIGGGVVVSAGKPPSGPVSGSTSLWDAVRNAGKNLFAEGSAKRRRAVLLFSDGRDTSSSGKLNNVIEEAIDRDLAVFSIGLTDKTYFELDETALKKLSEQTGGIARFPGKKKEKLEAALTDIARQLRGNYVIRYCGGAPKDRARLQIEVVDPEIRKVKPVLSYRRY